VRAVVTRVNQASVSIDGAVYSEIGSGLLVLLGSEEGDTQKDIDYIRDKVCGLRIYEDAEGKMNLSLQDVGGEILIVRSLRCWETPAKASAPAISVQVHRLKRKAFMIRR